MRSWVDELIIYSPDLQSTLESKMAKGEAVGANQMAIECAKSVGDVDVILQRYNNLKRLVFCTHGRSGVAYFSQTGGFLHQYNLGDIRILQGLFRGAGQLLFTGCEVARGAEGEAFLIASGQHFFRGVGGVVGGATVGIMGYPTGSVLPYVSWHTDALPESGKVVLYRIGSDGTVAARRTAR
ncbi:MAG: hypothetical protein IPL90_04425 [Holophagales bacterium]|nr:hypothetical protein [Holophagales bacterium]